MKLKNFNFRIWCERNTECPNKKYPSKTKYVYGKTAKILLSEVSGDCDIELRSKFRDKNNKKIYEGDILQKGEMKYLVRFKEESGFDIVELSDVEYVFFVSKICNESEIIGNIHENVDLLPKSLRKKMKI